MRPTLSLGAIQTRIARDRAWIEQAMTTVTTSKGFTMRIARFGSGPTIVCVPTITELHFIYAPQIRALSAHYELVLYDPRLSRCSRVSLMDRAHELHTIIDTLGRDAVHLLSWSDAGAIAYLVGQWWPNRILSSAFLGLAARYIFPRPLHWFTIALDRRPLEKFLPATFLGLLLSYYLGGSRIPPRWVFSETRRIPELSLLFKHSILPCMLDHHPVSDMHPIKSLMIGGDRDVLVRVEQMLAMARLLGNCCETIVIPGGEHMLGYATPEPVNRALRAFYATTGTNTNNPAADPK